MFSIRSTRNVDGHVRGVKCIVNLSDKSVSISSMSEIILTSLVVYFTSMVLILLILIGSILYVSGTHFTTKKSKKKNELIFFTSGALLGSQIIDE